jgi:hypothetical protein
MAARRADGPDRAESWPELYEELDRLPESSSFAVHSGPGGLVRHRSTPLSKDGLEDRLALDADRFPGFLGPVLPINGGELANSTGSQQVLPEFFVAHRPASR